MRYLRKPLNVERWGKLELWEAMDAAYILGGTEPERGDQSYLTVKATEVSQAMLAAYALNTLKPYQVTESGSAYYLASEVVKWAKEKGFNLPAGLEAAVQATSLSLLRRHDAATEALLRESAFNEDLLGIWTSKDLWNEDELVSLLCGIKPEAFLGAVLAITRNTEQAAREAIQRAIAVGALSPVWAEEKPAQWQGKYVPSKTLQYFKPSDVIAWARTKLSEFPKFPMFAEVAKENKCRMHVAFLASDNSDPVDALAPSIEIGTVATATPKKSARIVPQGGDALTPVIWEICYDMRDAGKEIKPRHVMSELRLRAEKRIWPLVGVVQGGVKYEFEKGEEDEIDSDALRKRIDKWKEIINGD